jgi:tripartite ATP-independent transporter DctP family solute receptor
LKLGIATLAIITLGATMGYGASPAAVVPVAQKKNFKARLAHTQGVSTPHHISCMKLAELAKEKSKGRFIIEVFPASQLGSTIELVEAVRMGTVEMHMAGDAWVEGIAPKTGVVNLPALFADVNEAYRAMYPYVLKEIYEKSLLAVGVRPLGFVSNDFRHVVNSKRPIKTLADMKGLKIRVPASKVYSDIVASMGGSPVPVDFTELFGAIQQGVVDGYEAPFTATYGSKLYEVSKHMALTYHMWGTLVHLVNEKFFQTLDDELKNILLSAGKEASDFGWQEANRQGASLLAELKKLGMVVTELDKQEIQNAVKGVWKSWQDRIGPDAQAVIQGVLNAKSK